MHLLSPSNTSSSKLKANVTPSKAFLKRINLNKNCSYKQCIFLFFFSFLVKYLYSSCLLWWPANILTGRLKVHVGRLLHHVWNSLVSLCIYVYFFLISKKFCGCKFGKYTKKNMSKNTLHTLLKSGVCRITDSFLESFSYQAKKHILYIKFPQHFGGYSDEHCSLPNVSF